MLGFVVGDMVRGGPIRDGDEFVDSVGGGEGLLADDVGAIGAAVICREGVQGAVLLRGEGAEHLDG